MKKMSYPKLEWLPGVRVCIDYRKLNEATRKDHFPLPFMDQMLERLAGNEYYCFLDGFSGYFQIPIDPRDQEKTTFTCPYGTFAYRRMPFGLCNAPGTFQRCMLAIFHDMVEKTMEVFMDDFSVFGNSFENCLSRLEKMLQRAHVVHGRGDLDISRLATMDPIVGTSGANLTAKKIFDSASFGPPVTRDGPRVWKQIYSRGRETTCQNAVEAKALPTPMMPVSLQIPKISLRQIWCPDAILSDRGNSFLQ
ncbi:reverse transcriptase domain-containing protein [Tanacetum coccineum]